MNRATVFVPFAMPTPNWNGDVSTLFVNNTDLMPEDWRFIEPLWSDPDAAWAFFHGVPRNGLERKIRRPNLARYRAALQAVRHARHHQPAAVLVSHLPAMTAATNILRRYSCPKVRHVAFAFNFTDLPTGARLSYFRRALQGIDEFVVFSKAEQATYARTFGLPQDRIRMLHWAMDAPVAGPDNPTGFQTPYLCAIGGEGRDYASLAEAMRALPEITLAIVARPYSVGGIRFPDNVKVFTNLPAPQTWRLAQDSMGMVIPLKSADTACGHITIVGAQLLNIPLAVTRSSGVSDYVNDDTARVLEPQNMPDLVAALRELSAGGDAVCQRQHTALELARSRSSLTHWVRYFESLCTAPGFS